MLCYANRGRVKCVSPQLPFQTEGSTAETQPTARRLCFYHLHNHRTIHAQIFIIVIIFKQNSTWARPGINRVFLQHLHQTSSQVVTSTDHYQVLYSPAISPTPAKDFQGKNLTLPGHIDAKTLSIAELQKSLPLPSNILILLHCLGSFSLVEGQQQPSQLPA